MKFHKYHGLGNDYLVLETTKLDPGAIRAVCDRHYGIGSDGVLLEGPCEGHTFSLRILNPDGSEAEKSGNGLRIFARYLFDQGRVGTDPFQVRTLGGTVRCQVLNQGKRVFVEMGRASFQSRDIPVTGPSREVLAEPFLISCQRHKITAVSLGNPHAVLHVQCTSAALVKRLGPLVERHPAFPRRTNVQCVQVLSSDRLRLEIWERGAGYTLASGSSACAAAAASHRLGLCEAKVVVEMPGGELEVAITPDFLLTQWGPVCHVAEGSFATEALEGISKKGN